MTSPRTSLFTILLGVFIVALVGVLPTPAEAQCNPCEEWQSSDQWYHRFPDQPPPGADMFDGEHEDWQSGPCDSIHSLCLAPGAGDLHVEELAANREALWRAIRENPAVRLNQEHGTAEVVDCEGNIVYRIPLSPGAPARANTRLAEDGSD